MPDLSGMNYRFPYHNAILVPFSVLVNRKYTEICSYFDDTISMKFWEMVEAKLAEQNSTYRWIAETVVKKSETTVSGWHNNNIEPRVSDALAIANALETTVEYLVTGESAAGWKPPERIAHIVGDLMLLDDPGLEAVSVLARGLASRIEHERRPSSGTG